MAKMYRLLLLGLAFLWLVCYWRTMQPAYGPLAWERGLAQQTTRFWNYSVRALAWAKILWNVMVLGSHKWVSSSRKVPSLPKNCSGSRVRRTKPHFLWANAHPRVDTRALSIPATSSISTTKWKFCHQIPKYNKCCGKICMSKKLLKYVVASGSWRQLCNIAVSYPTAGFCIWRQRDR